MCSGLKYWPECMKVTLSISLKHSSYRIRRIIQQSSRRCSYQSGNFCRLSRNQSQNNLMSQLAKSDSNYCSQIGWLDDKLIWRSQTCLQKIKKNPKREPWGCMVIALFTPGHSNPPCSLCDLVQQHKNKVC